MAGRIPFWTAAFRPDPGGRPKRRETSSRSIRITRLQALDRSDSGYHQAMRAERDRKSDDARTRMATLTLTGLAKSFGATQVLHGIDLTLADGELLVIVGASGCG